MYAKIKDGVVIKYPYTRFDLQEEMPGFCLPDPFNKEFLDQISAVSVFSSAQPGHDELTQVVVEATPVQSKGQWVQQWAVQARYASDAECDAAVKAELVRLQQKLSDQIDSAVAEAVGKPQRFTTEYLRREAAARTYVGACDAMPKPWTTMPAVPALIQSFAVAAGLEPYAAARLTISQADDLYVIQDQLANLRMRKYEVKRASSITAAQAEYDLIMAEILKVSATIT